MLSLLFYVLYIHGGKNISFNDLDYSKKYEDGLIEEREDGLYMCSNGKWICIDKKRWGNIPYV